MSIKMKKGDKVKINGKIGDVTVFCNCYDRHGDLQVKEAFVMIDGMEELFELEELELLDNLR